MRKNSVFLKNISLFLSAVCIVGFLLSCGDKKTKGGDKKNIENQIANQITNPELLVSICDRTQQVKEELLKRLKKSDCHKIIAKELQSINRLNLKSKGIASLKADDFAGLVNIENIDLSYNAIEHLPVGVFQGLIYLTDVTLTHNRLSSLPVGVFQGCVHLRHIKLDYNNLANLSVGVFQGLTLIENLYLDNNQLSTLELGIFKGMHINYLGLFSNLFSKETEDRIRTELAPFVDELNL